MQVSEVMHKGVSIADINYSLKRVAAIMKKEDIGCLPVYKNQRPVGFVTDRDIVVSCISQGKSANEPVSLAMSQKIISVKENQDVSEAIGLMEKEQISRLLVVDKGDRPVGMVSLKDLCDHLGNEEKEGEILREVKRG